MSAKREPFVVKQASDAKNGRGVFATQNFKLGDVILFEKIAFLAQERPVDPPLPFLVCEHCLRYIGSVETQLELMASDLETEPIPKVTHNFRFLQNRIFRSKRNSL